jgi:hypothetical protein
MIRATFTIHDQPTMLLDYKRQQELLTAAKDHTGESICRKLQASRLTISIQARQRGGSLRVRLAQSLRSRQSSEQRC